MNNDSLSENTLTRISNKIGHFKILLSEHEYDCIGVIRKETLWKEKLKTKEYGMNSN